jgi:hypothetical protein
VSEPKGRGADWTVLVPPDPPQERRGKEAPMKGDGEVRKLYAEAPEASEGKQ